MGVFLQNVIDLNPMTHTHTYIFVFSPYLFNIIFISIFYMIMLIGSLKVIVNVGHKNLNKVHVPRVVSMVEESIIVPRKPHA